MLHIGDRVVYPMHGAGEIAAIEKCDVQGEERSYYVLRMPMGNMKVMIPTDNAENIGLRDVIPEAKVQEVRDVLEDKPERAAGSWNKRFHANLERMKSGDICDVAAVLRNLTIQDRKRKISSGERRLADLARQIVVSELVYAVGKPADEVEMWMNDILMHNGKKH